MSRPSAKGKTGMRIAVVSSGFAHVLRGVEAWASDLAEALAELWKGEQRAKVTLLCGSAPKRPISAETISLPCLRRGTRANSAVTRALSPFGGWRFGFGSEYQTEQTTLAPAVVNRLAGGGYDIVHLQDPRLAWLLEKARRRGRHSARVILAHGTDEPLDFLERFMWLQELSPHYAARHSAQRVFMIPNFVDSGMFRPAVSCGEKASLRKSWGLSEQAFVLGSVGAIRVSRKRMDLLIRRFEEFRCSMPGALLLIAGSRTEESEAVERRAACAGAVKIFSDLSRERMPEFYRLLDAFALFAERELFGICFLEAMASGVPCIAQSNPVTEWILGDGGICVDAENSDAVASALQQATVPERRDALGRKGRERVEAMFSTHKVVEQIVAMYRNVLVLS